MKTLVVFFSHKGETYYEDGITFKEKGNAKVIAEKIHSMIDSDIFEIETIKDYPTDYKKCCDVALIEKEQNILPPLKNYVENFNEYEVFFLVYPNWWGSMPQAVFSFLNLYDFTGKIIYPICTHEGSKMGESEKDLKRVCSSAIVKNGLEIKGDYASCADKKIRKYVKYR